MSQGPSRRNIEVSGGREQNFLAHAEISSSKIDFSSFLSGYLDKMIHEIGLTALWDFNIFVTSFSCSQCLLDWLLKSQKAANRILAHAEISAHHRKIDLSCFFSVYLDKMIPEIGFEAFWDLNICLLVFPVPNAFLTDYWSLSKPRTEFSGACRNFCTSSKNRFSFFLAYIWIKWSLRYAWQLSQTEIFLLFVFHIPTAFHADYWSFRRPRTELWRMQKFLHIIEKSILHVFLAYIWIKWSLR